MKEHLISYKSISEGAPKSPKMKMRQVAGSKEPMKQEMIIHLIATTLNISPVRNLTRTSAK